MKEQIKNYFFSPPFLGGEKIKKYISGPPKRQGKQNFMFPDHAGVKIKKLFIFTTTFWGEEIISQPLMWRENILYKDHIYSTL